MKQMWWSTSWFNLLCLSCSLRWGIRAVWYKIHPPACKPLGVRYLLILGPSTWKKWVPLLKDHNAGRREKEQVILDWGRKRIMSLHQDLSNWAHQTAAAENNMVLTRKALISWAWLESESSVVAGKCHRFSGLKKIKLAKNKKSMLQRGSALGTDCQGIGNKLLLIAGTSFVQLDSWNKPGIPTGVLQTRLENN